MRDADGPPTDSDGQARGAEAPNGEESPRELEQLTELLTECKRGFRSDVAHLVDALDRGALLVPLKEPIQGVPVGEELELEEELSLVPHLVPDPAGQPFAVLFSDEDVLALVGAHLGWQTGDGDLECCTLPARIALQVAQQLLGDAKILGLVINPGDESELMLRRDELGSILQNKPIPLVGYVQAIPPGGDEKTLVSEMAEPPPAVVLDATKACQQRFPAITEINVTQQFNPERDLEPHLTLTLVVGNDPASQALDREAIHRYLVEQLDGKLPPPGYVDVLFESTS